MIDWNAFLVVAGASIIGASVVVSLFALGLRALHEGTRLTLVGAYASFTMCAAAALFGVYLIIPALHAA
jgi:hypothetical protein